MKKELRIRCWIDINGEKFFGPGRVQLLELIEETGSITKAAKSMEMSYKKAWDMVSDMNSKASKAYVISHKGGEKGGGAELTDAGRKIIVAYKQLGVELNAVVEKHRDILKFV
jgi:molybdate transport system regulatory protein